MSCEIKIQIEFDNIELLIAVYTSLDVESQARDVRRGEFFFYNTNKELEIEIKGDDLVATRGLLNSIMRLVQTSIQVFESIED